MPDPADDPVALPAVDSDPPVDHPDDDLTEDDAEVGHAVYLAVDDLNDHSTGLTP